MRSDCPISAVLDIFGDKWTLLVVRDIVINKRHKYDEFAAMDEGISTNILADRLKRLLEHGILEKRPYQQRPTRYEYHLTPKGEDLIPIIQDMIRLGLKHVPGTGASKGH
jgi:DNA-binding HxlR family transcriptional regulator